VGIPVSQGFLKNLEYAWLLYGQVSNYIAKIKKFKTLLQAEDVLSTFPQIIKERIKPLLAKSQDLDEFFFRFSLLNNIDLITKHKDSVSLLTIRGFKPTYKELRQIC